MKSIFFSLSVFILSFLYFYEKNIIYLKMDSSVLVVVKGLKNLISIIDFFMEELTLKRRAQLLYH